MEYTQPLIITIIAVILSGIFSGTEIAFMQSSKVRIGIDASKGGLINRIISGFNRSQDMFLSTLLIGNNIVLVVFGISFSLIINPWIETWSPSEALTLALNTIISTILILLMGEFIPKTVFRINPNTSLKIFALPLYIIYILLYPISLLSSALSSLLMRIFGISRTSAGNDSNHISMDQLDDYLQQTLDRKPQSQPVDNEVKIFRNAIDFKDTHIRDCMIPRNEIIAVNIHKVTRAQLLKTFVATGLSKIVVYNNDIDDVLGYIHVLELLNPNTDWTQRLKPVLYTPETMLANKMMRRLMAEKKTLAIVVDEFGGTSGLVTLEDIVEEIFGEIEDEHDHQRTLARRIDDDTFEFSGRVEIQRLNTEFHLNVKQSEEYQTLAGYILENLEALPQEGDTFEIDSFQISILKMSATRIELIRLVRLHQEN